MKALRVIVADDHPMIIEGLEAVFGHYKVEVVGRVTRTSDLPAEYEATKPDAVVLDVSFGGGETGLDAARELLAKFPKARIAIYSQHDQDDVILESYRMGCLVYVTKNHSARVLADALHRIQSGERQFLPGVAERLAVLSVGGDTSPRARLQDRELQAFVLMAQGLTNEEVAQAMNLSLRTVSTLSQSIKEKLQVQRAADLTLMAIRYKLIEA